MKHIGEEEEVNCSMPFRHRLVHRVHCTGEHIAVQLISLLVSGIIKMY